MLIVEASEVDDDLKEYNLEHYDDSDNDEDDEQIHGDEGSRDGLGMFGNIKNLVYHTSNEDDPYITLKDDAESDSEREDMQVLPTDNMVLAARVEDEVAHLEIYVYEDEADNLYVHHDVMLPAIPLCVEWLNTPLAGSSSSSSKDSSSMPSRRNLVAVGTMDPDIELWDLDTVDSMYPQLILGAGGVTDPLDPSSLPTGKKKKRKALNASKITKTHHTSSVLALAGNRNHSNLLASASADTTVKLWDLSSSNPSSAASSYTHHSDKVCSLSWHPTESTALLSGSYDRTVVAADMRTTDAGRTWKVESDVENVKWDPHDANCFYVTTEAGILYYFDARSEGKALWRLQAHDEAISAFDVNQHVPGYLATGSADKTVKLWNVTAAEEPKGKGSGKAVPPPAGPSLVTTRAMPDTGRIFSTMFAPDGEVAFRLAVAGSKGNLQIWDTSTNRGVRTAFAGKVKAGVVVGGEDEVQERLTGVKDDSSESESDEENEWEDEGEGGEGEDDDDEEMDGE